MLTLDKHLRPIRHRRVQPGRGGRREAFKITSGKLYLLIRLILLVGQRQVGRQYEARACTSIHRNSSRSQFVVPRLYGSPWTEQPPVAPAP